MIFTKRDFLWTGALALMSLAGCREPEAGQKVAKADATFASLVYLTHADSAGAPYALGAPFSTGAGERVELTEAKYYLSNPVLTDSAGRRVPLGPWYRLVSLRNPASWQLRLPDAPAGRYQSLELMVGVDSTQSMRLDHSGQLAPDSGMFWTWDTGFLHTKTEGFVGRGRQYFSWHVGGFAFPDANQRRIQIPLGRGGLALRSRQTLHTYLRIDVGRALVGALTPGAALVVHDKRQGRTVADQWARAFVVDSIEAQ